MDQIEKAIELLNANKVVAIPTETVYGLAAKINSVEALNKIFSTKERPFFDPLIVHVSSIGQAQECVLDWSPMAQILAEKFWPGPLTLVLPKSELILDIITSGLPNVGIRWPKHALTEEIIRRINVPLAAPSANKFGKTSPTKAMHVQQEFNNQVFVVDGDDSQIGIESTILAIKKNGNHYILSLLRKGAVLKSQIDKVLIQNEFHFEWQMDFNKIEAPGQMKHHYMPNVPFVICRNPSMKLSELSEILNNKLSMLPDKVEGVTLVKPKTKISKIEFLRLSVDPVHAAREIYSQLRSASLRNPQVLCFIQLPAHSGELWESLFDRLYKAACLIVD